MRGETRTTTTSPRAPIPNETDNFHNLPLFCILLLLAIGIIVAWISTTLAHVYRRAHE